MHKIITFDGTAGSGKGAIANEIAKYYNIPYLDTGKLYRGLAWLIINSNCENDFAAKLPNLVIKLTPELLSKSELSDEAIGIFASKIAKEKNVRDVLFDFQRNFIKRNKSCVLDGRDTGSVIATEAKFKFYIDARLEVRAKRRYLQNEKYYEKQNISLSDLSEKIKQRDIQDKQRKIAPLLIPEAAVIIDNSDQELSETIREIIKIIDK